MSAAPNELASVTEIYGLDELQSRYNSFTNRVIAECSLATELVGGQPAGEEGVRGFIAHHLGLTGDAADQAYARIMQEEIGERNVPSETGELQEKLSYGINVIRRDGNGPYLGDWMIKACAKAAASRLGIFQDKRGSKGDMAEMGKVSACGISLRGRPERIYLIDAEQDVPARTYFQKIMGRVQSPQGSKSIVNDSEHAPAGTRFAFQLQFYPGRIKKEDVPDIFASMMIIGLGSAKAFERGKFSIQKLVFEQAANPRKKG